MSRLGLSLPSAAVMRARGGAVPPEARALMARMTTAPSASRARAIATLVRTLKAAGIWSKLDLLYILAAHDAQAARLNWVPWTGTVTNAIRNNAMVGAVVGDPGSVPTNWSATPGAGLSRSVVGAGVESGIDYVDIRWSGMPTSTGDIIFAQFDTATAIPAATGQTWTGSLHCSLVGGSNVGAAPATRIRELNGSGGGLAESIFPLSPTAGALSDQRVSCTATFANAATSYASFGLKVAVTTGVAVDITLRIGAPQFTRMDVAGDPIRTTGVAASAVQTLQRFALTAVNSPSFVTDRGYAGGTNTYLATSFNPAVSGVQYTRNSAHIGAWSLTNRAAGSLIPGGVSTNTSLQCGLMARYVGDLAWINVNDQGPALGGMTRSDGLTLGSRLDSTTRSNYQNATLLGTASAASIAVPSVPLDLLCWNANGGASRSYWCTDRIAVWTMGGGLTSAEVSTFHAALGAYLIAVGAVTA